MNHQFVEFIPDQLESGVIYISIEYATAVHLCCCGCGNEVVTPFSPTDWRLTFDGVSVTLDPSIGNWAFDCQSHYWIRKNTVSWATKWSQDQISQGRLLDAERKSEYFNENLPLPEVTSSVKGEGTNRNVPFWERIKLFFRRK